MPDLRLPRLQKWDYGMNPCATRVSAIFKVGLPKTLIPLLNQAQPAEFRHSSHNPIFVGGGGGDSAREAYRYVQNHNRR
jgi:hypothetical protein